MLAQSDRSGRGPACAERNARLVSLNGHGLRARLERDAGERAGAPNFPALSDPLAGIETEIEYVRQINAPEQLQAGAGGAEIVYDAGHSLLPRHNELRALENFAPRKPPSFRHGEPPIHACDKIDYL
jgi:hypothetical protein